MNEILKQMHKIEQNAKKVNDQELLQHMNTKYRKLEDDLKVITNNIEVVYELI